MIILRKEVQLPDSTLERSTSQALLKSIVDNGIDPVIMQRRCSNQCPVGVTVTGMMTSYAPSAICLFKYCPVCGVKI